MQFLLLSVGTKCQCVCILIMYAACFRLVSFRRILPLATLLPLLFLFSCVVFFANLLIRTLIASPRRVASCDKQHNKSDIQRTPQNIVVLIVVVAVCMPFAETKEMGISVSSNIFTSFHFHLISLGIRSTVDNPNPMSS